ncbi:hypothetical protein [Streptomyces formicae]|uniref:Uncharacterized protein n=1 Tax=Streptomyces formicae TaxID=1616117 RepID=A0A291QN99_9ACTN|nr:hypothetical protein KY5_7999c [Streptomyces formicae]
MPVPISVRELASTARAMPKSMMRGPSGARMTLPGFDVQWTLFGDPGR